MTETLFEFDSDNFRDCQKLFRGTKNQEYYRGDCWIEQVADIEAHAERKTVGPISIILTTSRQRMYFRRTQSHIREDATDLSVLWFVKKGRLIHSNQYGSRTAEAGDFVITRSMSPFYIELQPGERDEHEVLHMTVPTHMLRGFVPDDANMGLFLPHGRREIPIAERILTDVYRDESDLAPETSKLLLETVLGVIGQAIKASNIDAPEKQTVAERRLEEVLRFIDVHLSDPHLSTFMVAKGCGISPRYLSFLMKLHGTSFSELVWSERLEKARNWLAASDPRDWSISEIAYGVGFKSAAHFSRMFKRVHGMNPRDFRGAVSEERAQEDYERFTDSGGLLQ